MRSKRSVLALATAAVLSVGVTVSASAPASASITFLSHVAINSGQQAQGPSYVGSVGLISVQSYGVAYSGAYTTNSAGARTSAADYCTTPGCRAQIGWLGPYPSGYPTGRNHGNASISYFEGLYD